MENSKLLKEIDFNSLNVDYADIRVEKTDETKIVYQSGDLREATTSPSLGAFLRVLKDGNWAFKSTTELNSLQSEFEALEGRVSLLPAKNKLSWPKRDSQHYEVMRYQDKSCNKASLKEKKDFCEALLPTLESEKLIQGPMVIYKDQYKEKWFMSSDGVSYHYDYNHAGAYAIFTLKDGDQIYEDSVKYFFQNVHGQSKSAISELEKAIEKAKPFIHAPTVEPGKYKVVLDSEITGIFTHESFGHKSEADFMLGDEAMKEEWQIGKSVGSENLSIVDDGNWPETSGDLPVDDEGNLKTKTYLIKNGKLAGRLHSTQTAVLLDEVPTGNARAMNFQYEPIVRMTNTYIEKGEKSLEELISQIDDGLYIVGAKHGMGMSTFTIAPSKAYKILNGKLCGPVKVSVISGNVFETLNLIEEVGSDFHIASSSLGGCGKMEQFPLPVADGGPSIIVKEMTVS
ncbi:MAG: hypothetical protein BM556_15170 [Bacteriovorax sp. MedPE-SWde]|nr:MAG: hypothetical protein BM556_15170 [Bacteriovorax sp. MedPE-SWde]